MEQSRLSRTKLVDLTRYRQINKPVIIYDENRYPANRIDQITTPPSWYSEQGISTDEGYILRPYADYLFELTMESMELYHKIADKMPHSRSAYLVDMEYIANDRLINIKDASIIAWAEYTVTLLGGMCFQEEDRIIEVQQKLLRQIQLSESKTPSLIRFRLILEGMEDPTLE